MNNNINTSHTTSDKQLEVNMCILNTLNYVEVLLHEINKKLDIEELKNNKEN